MKSTSFVRRPTAAFITVNALGFCLYFIMTTAQSSLKPIIFDYMYWFDAMKDNVLFRIFWLIGDGTEPHFHKTILGGAGVIAGSLLAYILDKKESRYAGFPICYGSNLWPWVFFASWLSLAISGLLFGSLRIEGDAWVPTFVPYVSIASAVVLLYGGNFVNVLTGAVLGALFSTPISLFFRHYLCLPMGLPGVIASVNGMWIGGIIVFEVCNILPWMKKIPAPPRSAGAPAYPTPEERAAKKTSYFFRKMLSDYSEPVFVSNEIAGGCLVLGSLLTWVLNPMQPYYGTGWFPALMLCQIITGSVALFVYWPSCVQEYGFPTFVPIVSVAPGMVLTFGPSMFVIVFSAILGALLCPAVTILVNRKIPSHWSGMVGTTFSMAFCAFAVGVLLKFLLLVFPFLA